MLYTCFPWDIRSVLLSEMSCLQGLKEHNKLSIWDSKNVLLSVSYFSVLIKEGKHIVHMYTCICTHQHTPVHMCILIHLLMEVCIKIGCNVYCITSCLFPAESTSGEDLFKLYLFLARAEVSVGMGGWLEKEELR